jgi:hypothetical protein
MTAVAHGSRAIAYRLRFARFGAGEQPGPLVLTAVDNPQSWGCPSQQSVTRKPIRRRMVSTPAR